MEVRFVARWCALLLGLRWERWTDAARTRLVRGWKSNEIGEDALCSRLSALFVQVDRISDPTCCLGRKSNSSLEETSARALQKGPPPCSRKRAGCAHRERSRSDRARVPLARLVRGCGALCWRLALLFLCYLCSLLFISAWLQVPARFVGGCSAAYPLPAGGREQEDTDAVPARFVRG